MRHQFLQIFNLSVVRIMVAALLVLAALPCSVTAQQNNAAVSPAPSATPASTVPQIIQFSGQFSGPSSGTAGSAPVPSGTVSITFTLYENEQGGTALWSETDNVQADAQGHYTALLGSASPQGLPMNLFTTVQAHWLAVQPLLQGFGEQPRVLLVSAPYALKAGDAETIGGLPPSAFLMAASGTSSSSGSSGASAGTSSSTSGSGSPPQALGSSTGQPVPPLSGSGTKNYIPIWKTGTALGNSLIYQTGGKVGVGTTTPGSALDVNGYINTSFAYKILGDTVLAYPGGLSDGNIALGDNALVSNTTGMLNTASGYSALNQNMTGDNNTASGFTALQQNTTGSNNTASGTEALYDNFMGNNNTASGYEALNSNTTASDNTANGSYALKINTTGGQNTADGWGALSGNTMGNDNTASGVGTMSFNTIGSQNTAIGWAALGGNTTGNNNIAIGSNAGGSVSGGNSNNIHIGNLGSSGDSGAIRIGTSGTQTSFFVAGVSGVNVSGATVLVSSSSQLGVASSSRRFKEDIHDMGDASDGLMRLRPVTFRYKQPFDDGSKPIQYGLIAEEVAEVYPDLVARSADGQIKTVKYQVLDPMLLNEVQRQQTEIRDQKALLLVQQNQIQAQRALGLEQQNLLKTQQAQIRELASQMKTIQASLRTRRRSGQSMIASAKGTPEPALPR